MHLVRGLSWLSVRISERDVCGGSKSALVLPAKPGPSTASSTTPLGPMAFAAHQPLSLHPLTLSRPANVKSTTERTRKVLAIALYRRFRGVCRSDAHSVPTRSWFPFLRRLHHSLPPLSGSDFSIRGARFPAYAGTCFPNSQPETSGPAPGPNLSYHLFPSSSLRLLPSFTFVHPVAVTAPYLSGRQIPCPAKCIV